MDRFKFRAYIKNIKSLREVTEIRFNEKYPVYINVIPSDIDSCISINYTFDEVELIQCTGLKDKNGNLIYEGDIVKRDSIIPRLGTEIGSIEYHATMFCINNGDKKFLLKGHANVYTFEILGNIYEDADLLEHE